MATKKVKRRKFNFKKFFKFLLFLLVLIYVIYLLSKVPVKNILVKGNNYLTDEQIIEACRLESYPPFFKINNIKLEKELEKLPLVKKANIDRKLGFRLIINISEYKVLFQIRSTDEYVLDTEERVMDLEINKSVPLLINYVPDDILSKMIKKFSELDSDVLVKISEIEFAPTTYDSERFLLYMSDGNLVYITLNKTKEFNSYTKIKRQLGDNKGILYLDSGNYFEIKE